MTKAYLLRNFKNSLGTYSYLHWITGFFLLLSSLVIYIFQACLISLAVGIYLKLYPSSDGGQTPISWFFYAALFSLAPIGFIFEPAYMNHIKSLSRTLKTKPHEERLFLSSIRLYFPFRKHFFLPLIKGWIFLPISLFKTSMKVLKRAIDAKFVPKGRMVETLHSLRGWRDGIPLERFNERNPDTKHRSTLKNLKKWGLINISEDYPNEIFVNFPIITIWASGRIFIFPLGSEVEIFTSIFVTLNNYAKSSHWKIKAELLVTIIVRLLFSLVPSLIVALFLYQILPPFSIKVVFITSSTLLSCLVFVVRAPNIFSRNTV